MECHIKRSIEERKERGLYRGLKIVRQETGTGINVEGKDYINFSSNDYLSLSSYICAGEVLSGSAAGTASSRLLTGNRAAHVELEKRTADFKGKPSALLFNSGYQANIGILSCMAGRKDVIFSDKLNHASILDGISLSRAKLYRYRHNDAEHLQYLLKKHRADYRHSLIVTETVFSMDGDIAPLYEICLLKNKFKSMLMVDEAHATGLFGSTGSGMAEHLEVTGDIDIIMGTFSKALAGFGAYAACSEEIKDYLVNFCRSFIYSTSLPEYTVNANLLALDKVLNEPSRRKVLADNTDMMRRRLKDLGVDILGETQIIPIVFKSTDKTISVSEKLKNKGYWVAAVRPPTVPEGSSRLRLSIVYGHDIGSLSRFIEDLGDILTEKGHCQ